MKMVLQEKAKSEKELLYLIYSIFLFLLLSHTHNIYAESEVRLQSPRLYPVMIASEENHSLTWGYISENGEWKIAPTYEDVHLEAQPLEATTVGYLYPTKYNGKWGFLNSDGLWHIKPKYDYVSNFRNGRALVRAFNGERQLIDVNEKTYFATADENITFTPISGGISIISKKGSDTIEFMNINGEVLFELSNIQDYNLPYDYPYPQPICSEGLIAVKTQFFWGFLDMSGEWVISPQYDEAMSFSEGLAAVRIDNKWGYINPKGEWIIYPQFEAVHNFSEGLAGVKANGKWIFIDKNGHTPFLFSFEPYIGMPRSNFYGMDEGAYTFHNGLAGVYSSSGLGGYIDKTGHWKIAPSYVRVTQFVDKLAFVETCYIDANGKSIIPFLAPNRKY